ncbi:hypothetical protein FHX80_111214 [Streptomyces brevispora]|uniref:Uncharacterized protein n=1 Tax=Streptomyces brevispora TaxID=887462 RepID=A0A561UTV6_9ACTN|nr:hypothetical protein [Streptomyces brevispora]TWG02803.1 hypothetical protein FHX80_111214 [Streptomyces brevispora]
MENAAAGLLLVLVSAGLLALVPGRAANSDAYRAAPDCRAGASRSDGYTTAVLGTVNAKPGGHP